MKSKISISVDEETLEKIDESISKKKFRNRSHAFEFALNEILIEVEDAAIKSRYFPWLIGPIYHKIMYTTSKSFLPPLKMPKDNANEGIKTSSPEVIIVVLTLRMEASH